MEDNVAFLLNNGMTLAELERLSEKQGLPIDEIAAAARNIIERGGSLSDDVEKPPAPKLATISAAELQKKEIAPVREIVPGLITLPPLATAQEGKSTISITAMSQTLES